MRNHEQYGTGEDINTLRDEKELLEFGEKSLPKYVQSYWQDACKTMGAERINGLTDTLVAIKDGETKQAVKMLKNNWLSDGLVMGSVATYLPEGVDVVRQVHAEVYGEGRTKENSAFLGQMEKWHKEQRKKLAKEVGGAVAKANSEAYHGPTTREKFMERVHDTFGPEEARMLEFKIRDANKIGKPTQPPFGLTYYDPYAASVSFIGDTDEPKYIPGIMDWTEENYKNDMKDYKRNFIEWISDGSRTDEQIRWLEKAIDNIDACLEDTEELLYKGKNFPTTMHVQGDIEDFKNSSNDFMYCDDLTTAFNSYFGHRNKTYGEITARLYMCPRTDNMIELIDEFRHKCGEKDIRYRFKYSSDPYRNDRIVIYTNYDRINDHLDVLKEIKQEHPELFRDMDNTRKNPFWGKIDGAPEGVYFGEEPPKMVIVTKEGREVDRHAWTSYSKLRANAFEEADRKWAEEIYKEKSADYIGFFGTLTDDAKHFDSPSDISWENAKKLEQIFREELDKANVNPDNMCFNKSNKDIYVTDEDEG